MMAVMVLYAELLQVSGITASFGGRQTSVLDFFLSVAAAAAAASGTCPLCGNSLWAAWAGRRADSCARCCRY
jgi:hypothetical protein